MNPAAGDEQLIAQARRLSLDAPHRSSSPTPAGGHGDERVRAGNPAGGNDSNGAAAAGVAAGARPPTLEHNTEAHGVNQGCSPSRHPSPPPPATVDDESHNLEGLPAEILFRILEFLDVSDLLATSRTSHQLRSIALTPLLHAYRLRRVRFLLPPLLSNPTRPSLPDLIARSIFLTRTSEVSRRLGRSLVSVRLARRLARRPPIEVLVERAVLPKECVPGMAPVHVAPSIVQRRKAIERERIKDRLRRWVAGKWRGEVREREESQRRWEEMRGVGRVWQLRKYWEGVGRGGGPGCEVRLID